MPEQQNIIERIHASYYQLAPAEKKVADYVLAQREQIQFMSITQLADECGTAEATISRFCRSLKLKGFNAFKIELARHSAGGKSASGSATSSTDTLSGRAHELGQLSKNAIQQTIELIQPELILRSVELFEQANRVICVGAGGSMLMAQEFAHLFSTITGKFIPVSDSHTQMSTVATLNPQDVLVLFSYSGATTGGIQLLELAKSRQIPTILVTRFNKSPAANLADVVLRCGSKEGPFQFGSIPAKVAQLVIMDVLFQEYFHRNRQQCEENIQSIASALSGMHI